MRVSLLTAFAAQTSATSVPIAAPRTSAELSAGAAASGGGLISRSGVPAHGPSITTGNRSAGLQVPASCPGEVSPGSFVQHVLTVGSGPRIGRAGHSIRQGLQAAASNWSGRRLRFAEGPQRPGPCGGDYGMALVIGQA